MVRYLRDLREFEPLRTEEEIEAGWLASFGDEPARERLVLAHLHQVIQIAFEFRQSDMSLHDLISEGNIGLLRAAQRFKPGRGAVFGTYASYWIRQRMHRALWAQRGCLRWPGDFGHKRTLSSRAEHQLYIQLGRMPTHQELAQGSGLTRQMLRRLRTFNPRNIVSLCATPHEESDCAWAELLPDESAPPPDEILSHTDDCVLLRRLVGSLRPRERQVLELRFGLKDGCERTLEEVGVALGYVRQGIHKIERQALAKLARHLVHLEGPRWGTHQISRRCGPCTARR